MRLENLVVMLCLVQTAASNCQSRPGWAFEETPPKYRKRSSLSLCQFFKHNTCCNRTHTDPLAKKVRAMQLAEFSYPCVETTELVFCYGCHPEVGVGKINRIDGALCDKWYRACKHEFFERTGISAIPTPCLDNSLLCSPLGSFVESGQEMCKLFGYKIAYSKAYNGNVDKSVLGEPEKAASTPLFNNLKTSFSEFMLSTDNLAKTGVAAAVVLVGCFYLFRRK